MMLNKTELYDGEANTLCDSSASKIIFFIVIYLYS